MYNNVYENHIYFRQCILLLLDLSTKHSRLQCTSEKYFWYGSGTEKIFCTPKTKSIFRTPYLYLKYSKRLLSAMKSVVRVPLLADSQ